MQSESWLKTQSWSSVFFPSLLACFSCRWDKADDKGIRARKREPALSLDREGTDERLACLQDL